MFSLEFYTLANGKKPVEDFIMSLEPKMQVKALDSLVILEERGNTLREPYSKAVKGSDGLFELRIKFSSDITRIFYFFCTGRKIIATNGFVKKDNKTPRAEIGLAMKYKADYERRFPK
ncbi:type II toxin-antitoxin system RelE/ParE family toxin [Christensenellaceae bacterium OttesenSCG-928-K19]|nr:type II toxin-antitoxin system RelE/ParE family toxin [Christensenellaceae bacterium OttesenSCG-928-K19]